MKNTIKCELCGLVCSMQIPATHLRSAHQMTTKAYKALGYKTLSPARLNQLLKTPLAIGTCLGGRGKFGKDHWNWKGGHLARSGYRIIYIHGRKNYEHRLVAEEMLGRSLKKDEVVHHKDGNRSNNSPDNLVVMKRQEHDKLKDGTRAYFHTNDDMIKAAKDLFALGWAKIRIERALRIHHDTLRRWIKSD
jgi:hypothetical protein